MSKWAYYNEFDPAAAQWLRNLIAAGHIAPGVVDERSIEDVCPDDLREFRQCHFFAGIGVWSYALRRAGWPDDRSVWTGSCPCQPFSAAGPQAGFADERHLWPHFHWLIGQRRPPVVLGEQVASKAVEPWVDLVQADLEALGYAFGGVPFPSAGVGAPHIRDRLFWVAEIDSDGQAGRVRPTGRLGDSRGSAVQRNAGGLPKTQARGDRTGREDGSGPDGLEHAGSSLGWLADLPGIRRDQGWTGGPAQERNGSAGNGGHAPGSSPAGPVNGHWGAADWLLCRDGKWRPVEPGTFPLADGAPSRVVRLRAYGNAINAEAATTFIESYLDARSPAGEPAECSGCEPGCEECEL